MKILSIFNISIIYTLILCSFFSCSEETEQIQIPSYQQQKPVLLKANKGLVIKNNERIEAFIKRRNWEMNKTANGLRFLIYSEGKGVKPNAGDKISMKYTLSLLDGTEIYTSKKEGTKEFILGSGNAIRGLEEAIILMHQGDKAIFIIPSYLAWGLIGDQRRVPALADIVYNIELTNVQKN